MRASPRRPWSRNDCTKKRARPATTWDVRNLSNGFGPGKHDYETRILSQLQRMGCSCDWERTRFTLDPVCARAVRHTFFDLFRKQSDLPRQTAGELGHVPADGRQR